MNGGHAFSCIAGTTARAHCAVMFKTMLGIGMATVLAACASNTANAPAAEVPAAWEIGEPTAWRATDPSEPNEPKPAQYATGTPTTTTAAPVK